jgi:xylulokinase
LSYKVVGEATDEAVRETGLASGTPVVAGTPTQPQRRSRRVADFGDMMLMLGSSIFYIMKTPELVTTEHFWSSNFLEEGSFAFLGGMSTSGSLTTWFRDQFAQFEVQKQSEGGEDPFTTLARLAETSRPLDGLILLPISRVST